ncbi:MAG: hypothetical protein EHM70_11910 [Chloroflexota bacterium]|nr:MAG: hypothetical protein EHM70_11910 [Chloroflexota bacterium]
MVSVPSDRLPGGATASHHHIESEKAPNHISFIGEQNMSRMYPSIRTLKRVLYVLANLAFLIGMVFPFGSSQAQAEEAASPIYVRQNGNDVNCNGTADVDHSASAAPNCALKTIEAAVIKVDSGGIIYVAQGTYPTGIVEISKNLTLTSNPANTSKPVIRANVDTIDFSDARGWILILGSVTNFTIEGLIIDGNAQQPKNIMEAIRSHGQGVIRNNDFMNIRFRDEYDPYDKYPGVAIFMDNRVDVIGNTFTNIGRFGVRANGPDVSDVLIEGNTYTGKGQGTHLDFAFEISGGGTATISGNTITNNRGSRLNRTSAGILTARWSGDSPTVTIEKNRILNNATGILVDGAGNNVTVRFNSIVDNTVGLENDGTSSVVAENNWWGCNGGPGDAGCNIVSGNVDADPWLTFQISASESTLFFGQTTTITASLTINSSGIDTSALGSLPDQQLVEFAATIGTTEPVSTTTTNGVATTTFTAGIEEGNATIEASTDHANTSTQVRLMSGNVFLPLIPRNFDRWVNGNFEKGLTGWATGRGRFENHGTGLPQSVTFFENSNQALIGNPTFTNGRIPVGYGYIAQTFTVLKPFLEMDYRVVTYDVIRGTQDYFDSFEVSVNLHPADITDTNRGDRGCADAATVNPTGVVSIPSGGGLAFCGGYIGTQGHQQDLGWKTVRLDLTDFVGQNVTVYFAMWSREYAAQYYDDRGFYNTWVYIDDVRPTE